MRTHGETIRDALNRVPPTEWGKGDNPYTALALLEEASQRPSLPRYPEALPSVIPLRGDAGPCQLCTKRAAFKVTWAITGYGEAITFYCADCAPSPEGEGE
jgi:hypothetical protein